MKLTCCQCSQEYERTKSFMHKATRSCVYNFCSQTCSQIHKNRQIQCECNQCHCNFLRKPSQVKKSKLLFCSKSCSATYYNTHKSIGNRRSKLELFLERRLTELYPDLSIVFNDKLTINSELDIYIPSLQLAFELNGIFHYEPIYGPDKLNQIKNNDDRKFQACIERNIALCIIDTTSQKYFKEKTSARFLEIITDVIERKRRGSNP